MAELSTLARPYAEALFETARAQGADRASQWLPVLEALGQVARHPDVARTVADPNLSDQQRLDLLAGLVARSVPDGLPQPLASFLKLAIENGRLAALPQVAAQFRKLKNDAEGVADCVVESAFALDKAQVADLLAALARKFAVTLRPEVRLNPDLIGGVRVTVGDHVLDTSVRAQLDTMRAQLTAA
jgi:F-type H+-transporting ATPase subunit delta